MPALTRALTTALTSPTIAISTYFPRLLRRLPAQTYQVLDKAARDGLALQFGPRIKRRHIHGELPIVYLGLEYALGIVVGISCPGGHYCSERIECASDIDGTHTSGQARHWEYV